MLCLWKNMLWLICLGNKYSIWLFNISNLLEIREEKMLLFFKNFRFFGEGNVIILGLKLLEFLWVIELIVGRIVKFDVIVFINK